MATGVRLQYKTVKLLFRTLLSSSSRTPINRDIRILNEPGSNRYDHNEGVKKLFYLNQGILNGGSITVLLTSCLTGLESAVRQLTIFVFICKTD